MLKMGRIVFFVHDTTLCPAASGSGEKNRKHGIMIFGILVTPLLLLLHCPHRPHCQGGASFALTPPLHTAA